MPFMLYDTKEKTYWFETLNDTARGAIDDCGEARVLDPTDFAIALATGEIQVHEVEITVLCTDGLRPAEQPKA
jgi:hypothetical protein